MYNHNVNVSTSKSPSHQKFNLPKKAGLAARAVRLSERIAAYERDHKTSRKITHMSGYHKPGSMKQGS